MSVEIPDMIDLRDKPHMKNLLYGIGAGIVYDLLPDADAPEITFQMKRFAAEELVREMDWSK